MTGTVRRMRMVMPCALVVLLLACLAPPLQAGTGTAKGRKWRVACVESGPYGDFQKTLRGLAKGLAELGIISNGDIPAQKGGGTDASAPLWAWLAEHAGGDRLAFLPDGFYTDNWDSERRAASKTALLNRIRTRRDVDLILAFGTWAGQDFATDEHNVPVFVINASDPVGSGIITSPADSGRDHVHADVEPDRTHRQISLFYDTFRFKRLGVVYEDNVPGRSYANIADVEKAAAELGFSVVSCTDYFDVPEEDVSRTRLLACHRQLAGQVDAMYLTLNNGMQPKHMVELLQPFIDAKIPTFSQSGPEEVRLGVLLSIAQADFDFLGRFNAEGIAALLSGAKPREIPQIFETPLKIAVNLRMAMLIGWNPPFDILAAVDEICQELQNAP